MKATLRHELFVHCIGRHHGRKLWHYGTFFFPKLFGSTFRWIPMNRSVPWLCQCYANAMDHPDIIHFPPVRPLMFIAHGPMVFMVFMVSVFGSIPWVTFLFWIVATSHLDLFFLRKRYEGAAQRKARNKNIFQAFSSTKNGNITSKPFWFPKIGDPPRIAISIGNIKLIFFKTLLDIFGQPNCMYNIYHHLSNIHP